MLIKIKDLVTADELRWLKEQLASTQFVDGTVTAKGPAGLVKNNREADLNSRALAPLVKVFMQAVGRNLRFRMAALPLRVSDPVFAHYTPGMTYGEHVDAPVMGGGPGGQFRCDVATTLFLSDPDEYEGGELRVRTSFGDQTVKLPAGHAVVYPANSLHQVMPVTGGERLVAVAWIQSMVRSEEKRQLLFELNEAVHSLAETEPDSDRYRLVDRSYTNLVRMWSEL